jgi:arylsulfatase A-like enzyme
LVLLAGVFFSAGTGRWHLIRHNQMIGSAAFHLFATPVAEIEEIEWSAHRHGAPVGQPSWVLDLHSQGEAFAERTATAAGAPGQEIRRPDIVFVMLDTLRADSLAAYGGDPTAMPALNQRAASSTVFTDVLANAPWTQPSVASFFTGLLPEEHGVISIHHRMSTGVATLAEVLQSLGYQTAAFVANPVIVNPDAGFVRGFDHFEFVPGAAGAYARADLLTDRAAAWLAASSAPEEAGAESSETGTTSGPAPLFLYIHYMDPHVPYLSSGITAREDATLSFERARGYYVDELRFLDVELERLFTLLDAALPRSRATLITADHGEEFGEHDGLGHSQTLHSEVLRIPALFQWARRRELPRASRPTPETGAAAEPGPAPDGDVIDVRLEGRDFFDLLLRTASGRVADLETWSASADRPARIASLYFEKDPGRSALVHYLLRPYRAHIYSRMIQRDDLRYIRSAFGPTDELYDLAADPGERVNAAATKAAQVAYLRAELDGSPADWVRRVPLQLSDEALEDLRTLGYIR